MNKLCLLLLCLLALPFSLQAQIPGWHVTIDIQPLAKPYFRHSAIADGFLVNTDRCIVQQDYRGAITGFLEFGANPILFAVFKKQAAGSGLSYFILVKRGYVGSKEVRLESFLPGAGVLHELALPDDVGLRAQVLELSDGNFLIVGKKFYWKIRYDEASGFSTDWTRPAPLSPTATTAVAQRDGAWVLADETGRLHALDTAGNTLWQRQYPVQFWALKPLADGFIAAGTTADKQAAIVRLGAQGEIWWTTLHPGQAAFYDIIPTAAGGFAATGSSAGGQIALVALNHTGQALWSRAFGEIASTSAGFGLLELPGGGFFVAGRGKAGLALLRTDAQGLAPEAEVAPIHFRRLKTASLQADVYPGPTLFNDGSQGTMVSLADSNASLLFAHTPWLGGIDPEGAIRVAVGDYSAGFKRTDFRPGGFNTVAQDFNRVWAVRRTEVNDLRRDFLDNQTLDEPVPNDLLTWPARGNPHWRYRLDFAPVETDPEHFPAPFVDANGDGRYNVYDGDYPVLKGDQMVWCAFTDSSAHERTKGKALLADVQAAAYTYACTGNPAIDQAVFTEHTIINRSDLDYSEAYVGFFSDPDLGCYLNDYIGSLPQADAWYVYNQNQQDSYPGCFGVQSFGADVPVQSVQFLTPALDHTVYHVNPAFGTPPPGTIDPYTILGFYRNLQGRWIDGTPFTVGGYGYNPFNMNLTNYFFMDNPADPQGWTMCTANLGYQDRRVVASHGPFTFAAGDTFRIAQAFTMHRDIPLPCPDIFGLVTPTLNQLKQWHTDSALDQRPALEPVYTTLPGRVFSLDASTAGATAYAWSTGSAAPQIEVAAPGQFTVTVTGATGCTREETVLVQATTGAGNLDAAPDWRLWPNPTSGQIFISCAECPSEPLTAVLYHPQGQLVRQLDNFQLPGRVDVSGLSTGLYVLELRGAKSSWGWQRLAVVK